VIGALALGANFSCAAIWDIEDPLPLVEDAGLDAPLTDVTVDSLSQTDADAQPSDAGRPDADGSVAETAGPEADAGIIPGAHGYTWTQVSPAPAFVDACLLTGAAKGLIPNHNYADTGVLTLAIPFAFYGVSQTEYWANTQGILGFGTRNVHNANVVCPLPSTTHVEAHPAVYAFADNIQTGNAGVCIGVTGTVPKQLVVTWEDASLVSDSSSHLTFSVVLTETANTIDLVYKTMTGSSEAQGTLAMIGLEDGSGTLATMFSCMPMTPVISTPFAIRFTPNP
jgi:hypothetical protein